MEARWVFALCVAALLALAAIGTYRTGVVLRTWTPPHNLLLALPDNILRVGLVGACVILGLTAGPGAGALGWSLSALAPKVGLGVLAGAVFAVLGVLLARLAERLWGSGFYDDRLLRGVMPANRGEWGLVLLALLPAAALEELLFRSLPLGGLGWLLPPAWLLWPLAVLFGLLHWPQGGWGVAGTTLAAVAFGLLFIVTRSIWPPLAAHYTFNVLQLLLAARLGVRPLRAGG